jgi:glycosyltransferase involved in cell wall biosynthesis
MRCATPGAKGAPAEMSARTSGRFGVGAIPVFIPAFNNPTYLRQILESLGRFPALAVVVLDNGSTYRPMQRLYGEIEREVSVLRLGRNLGPRAVFQDAAFYASLPRHFCLTDPDLALNRSLPPEFPEILARVVDAYRIGKAGFALELSDRDRMVRTPFRHVTGWHRIWEHEAQHWRVQLPDPAFEDPLYLANIDTTFALYDKAYFRPAQPFEAIRVAGRFTCRHLPWYVDNGLPADEERAYRESAEFSYFLGDRPAAQVRSLFAHQDAAQRCRTREMAPLDRGA